MISIKALTDCYCKLKAKVDANPQSVELVCETFCPIAIGELENVDGPIDLNPNVATAIAWGGFQSTNDDVVSVDGSQATIVSDDVCGVHVAASVTFVNAEVGGATGNAQRAHPELWLLRNGQRVALAQTYIRDANGQDSDTATINWYDLRPDNGTNYSLEVQQDSIATSASGQADTGTLEIFRDPETSSYLQVAAHRSFDICKPVADVGADVGAGSATPTLPAANGKVVSDNFQDGDGNAPFNLQVRNTTGNPVNWEALVENVPYATIPNVSVTPTTSDNGDGTFSHLFSGGPLAANITIKGGLPSPAGNGSGLSLYCEAA